MSHRRPAIAPSSASAQPKADSAAADWLALDQQLCFGLYATSLAMTRLYKPLLDPLGLTYPQYLVMLVLWEADDRTVNALGERLQLDSGTLTPLLKRLETAGLLQRQRDPDDERRVRIRLSPAGRELRTRAVAVPRAVACATGCSLDDLLSLTAQLRHLREQLLVAAPDHAPDESTPRTSNPAA